MQEVLHDIVRSKSDPLMLLLKKVALQALNVLLNANV